MCKFRPGETSGATPKFECVFEGGELLKVKYGESPEIYSEVAATRLMRALGAGADRMYLVSRLRCFGCPKDPHAMLSCLSSPFKERRRECEPIYGVRKASGKVQVDVDYRRYVDFTNVAIERKQDGRVIKADGASGWGWDELAEIQKGHGRAERDALRLLAVFLNNWDNRADNQRLICLDDGSRMADGGCHAPLAYMQDVGATFGYVGGEKSQRKLDVEGWQAVPDLEGCRALRREHPVAARSTARPSRTRRSRKPVGGFSPNASRAWAARRSATSSRAPASTSTRRRARRAAASITG